MNLEQALSQFDAVDANLRRLERIWQDIAGSIPEDILFMSGSPEDRHYDDLRRAYVDIVGSLPAIDGWVIRSRPMALNEIAQSRFDAREVGEVEAMVSTEEGIQQPGKDIDEYRFRLNRARRSLVRDRSLAVIREVDELLPQIANRVPRDRQKVADPDFSGVSEKIAELERLVGGFPAQNRIQRHLAWGEGQDVHDIADWDWPPLRRDIEAQLYSSLKPLPVAVDDLGTVVARKPLGSVKARLAWEVLNDEQFERLLYNIVSDAAGYDKAQWLMHTNAPDKGRDLSVRHAIADSLSGTSYERVIIQAKHWLTKSIAVREVAETIEVIKLWEPPPVHAVILATSGRFSVDAVMWIDNHNRDARRPRIEMWASSHLESLLASRPYLVAEFGLRPNQ
jgi:hypothetical protein